MSDFEIVERAAAPPPGRLQTYGRSVRVLAAVMDNPGKSVKVTSCSQAAARKLVHTVRKLAEKEHRRIGCSREGTTMFLWLEETEPEVAAR